MDEMDQLRIGFLRDQPVTELRNRESIDTVTSTVKAETHVGGSLRGEMAVWAFVNHITVDVPQHMVVAAEA